MLSEAKHLVAPQVRPFASLKVTQHSVPVLVVKFHYGAQGWGDTPDNFLNFIKFVLLRQTGPQAGLSGCAGGFLRGQYPQKPTCTPLNAP